MLCNKKTRREVGDYRKSRLVVLPSNWKGKMTLLLPLSAAAGFLEQSGATVLLAEIAFVFTLLRPLSLLSRRHPLCFFLSPYLFICLNRKPAYFLCEFHYRSLSLYRKANNISVKRMAYESLFCVVEMSSTHQSKLEAGWNNICTNKRLAKWEAGSTRTTK